MGTWKNHQRYGRRRSDANLHQHEEDGRNSDREIRKVQNQGNGPSRRSITEQEREDNRFI